jgi:hypothetical protein
MSHAMSGEHVVYTGSRESRRKDETVIKIYDRNSSAEKRLSPGPGPHLEIRTGIRTYGRNSSAEKKLSPGPEGTVSTTG